MSNMRIIWLAITKLAFALSASAAKDIDSTLPGTQESINKAKGYPRKPAVADAITTVTPKPITTSCTDDHRWRINSAFGKAVK